MYKVSSKVPETLIKIYRLAFKGVKLESFYFGNSINIISREAPGHPYKIFWAELDPSSTLIIEEEEELSLRVFEKVGQGIINPSCMRVLKVK